MHNDHDDITEKIDIETIFAGALKDPELFSTINIEDLLDSIDNEKSEYLENKTLKSVTHDVFVAVNRLNISTEKKEEFCRKLTGYLHVDEIRDIRKGRYIRWVREDSHDTLARGSTVVNVKFVNDGTNIVCKNNYQTFIQIKFDQSVIFQKLTTEENLILMLNDYLETHENT
jgi:hypothetical protein